MLLKFNLFLLIIACHVVVYGQGDSYTKDTTRLRNYKKEIDKEIYSNPDISGIYIDSLFDLSSKIQDSNGLYLAHNYRAINHYLRGAYQKSLGEYTKALNYADDKIPYQKVRILSNIALSHRQLNNMDSALYYLMDILDLSQKYRLEESYYQSVLDLANLYLAKEDFVEAANYFLLTKEGLQIITDKIYMVKAHSSLGMFYKAVMDFDQAYFNYMEAIRLDELNDDINFLGSNYSNLGELYLRVENNYDTAIYFYRRALEFELSYKLPISTLTANVNIGNAFLEKNNIDSAYFYYSMAYNDSLLQYAPVIKAATLINMGLYFNRKGNKDEARTMLLEGLEEAKKLELLTYQMNAYKELVDLEEGQGNFHLSLNYYSNYHMLSDSLKKTDALKNMAIIEYEKNMAIEKYSNELLIQESEIQERKILAQSIIIILIISSVLLLLVFIIIILNNRKKIKQLNQSLHLTNGELEESNTILIAQKQEMKDLLMTKDRFVSILGHDLKNPFSGLLSYLDLILEDWDLLPDSDKKDGIRQLYNSSNQTYEFLQSILDFGKTQQGLVKCYKETINLSEVVEEIIVIFFTQYNQKGLKIEVNVPKSIKVFTDRIIFSQILQNLFTNAIKYSHVGAMIRIKASQNNSKTKVCIIDQGIGIPKEKIEDLFKLDTNFNRPGTLDEKSTGMGLILCKEYANILNAELTVTSEEQKGSEFCILISDSNDPTD